MRPTEWRNTLSVLKEIFLATLKQKICLSLDLLTCRNALTNLDLLARDKRCRSAFSAVVTTLSRDFQVEKEYSFTVLQQISASHSQFGLDCPKHLCASGVPLSAVYYFFG
jgi:hypothetical protein